MVAKANAQTNNIAQEALLNIRYGGYGGDLQHQEGQNCGAIEERFALCFLSLVSVYILKLCSCSHDEHLCSVYSSMTMYKPLIIYSFRLQNGYFI